MLVNLKTILAKAEKGKYAVPAFNVNNMEIVQSAIQAAVKLKSPVILQTSEGAIEYAGMQYLKALVYVASEENVPVVFHLDHGKNMKTIKMAVDNGYSSVMIDASLFPYGRNIQKTKQVVAWARSKKISVEAELGAIEGVEDLVSVTEKQVFFTNPNQAKDFVKRTGCDALAISIGTAHGAFKFKGKPRLDINRLKEIDKIVGVPLVLHGASEVPQQYIDLANKYGAKLKGAKGVSDAWLRSAIKGGIRKVNTDTDLRLAFTAAERKTLFNKKSSFDPRKLLGPARDEMQKICEHRIKVCGSAGKA